MMTKSEIIKKIIESITYNVQLKFKWQPENNLKHI